MGIPNRLVIDSTDLRIIFSVCIRTSIVHSPSSRTGERDFEYFESKSLHDFMVDFLVGNFSLIQYIIVYLIV